MKPTYLMLAGLSLAVTLAACGQKPEKAADGSAANTPADASTTLPPAQSTTKAAKGMGTVTAVDVAAGTITLDHAPIPEAGWPAMTMGFTAAPTLVQSVKVGDKVAFDLTLKDGGGEITAIAKQ